MKAMRMRIIWTCALLACIAAPLFSGNNGAGHTAIPNLTRTLQTSCDNSEGLPPVGDQVVAGSCYAWAAAYYYLTHLQWQEHGWDVTDPAHQFSPAFVYNLTNGGVDDGAWEGENARADAFRVFETMGCATMADMPYSYLTFRTFPGEAAFRNGMQFRTLSTHRIELRSLDGIQELKSHLLEGNLAVLGIYGYGNLNDIRFYNNTYCVGQTTGSRLYWHEVTVVGFDDTRMTADGKGAFRLVNSWSASWGDRGFFWMSYEAVMNWKTSSGYALYATDRIDYEPALAARVLVQHDDRYNLRYEAGFGAPASPDTALTFFDFHPLSLQEGVPQSGGAIVFDLTDLLGLLRDDAPNELWLGVRDSGTNNGLGGSLRSLSIEDLTSGLCASSLEAPVDIADDGAEAVASVILDYTLPPPQNVQADLDSSNGDLILSWDAPFEHPVVLGFRVYEDGSVLDTTSVSTYSHQVPTPGTHVYSVAAVFPEGDSPQSMVSVSWGGPFGIPYVDGFEEGLGGWAEVGTSGVPAEIRDDRAYDGACSVGLTTNVSDNTVIARGFEPMEGVEIKTWFLLEDHPAGMMGVGAALGFGSSSGDALGVFITSFGQPAWLYQTPSGELSADVLDPAVTVGRDHWHSHRIWYLNGSMHTMLLDSAWNVLANKVVTTPDIEASMTFLAGFSLDGKWNYYDNFAIRPWTGPDLAHFTPVTSTGAPYALIITHASLDERTLTAGDEIAVFDGELCVGAVEVEARWPLVLNAWEAAGESAGFMEGNVISLRIWNQQNETEHRADVTFEVGDGSFGYGKFSRLILVGGEVVEVMENAPGLPTSFSLSPAFPNPVNSRTLFDFALPLSSHVRVAVFNTVGQRMAVLVDKRLEGGRHRLRFDADDLPSGVYFIRARVRGKLDLVRKVVVIR